MGRKQKKTFRVRVYLSTFYEVDVEATNMERAMEIAESSNNWDSPEILENLALQDEETEVEEI